MADATVAGVMKTLEAHVDNCQDSTYQIAIWSVVETGLGITASSLFTLRPLFRWLRHEKLSYDRHTRSPRRGYNECELSSLNKDGLKKSHPRVLSPADMPGKKSNVINTVKLPPLRDFITSNISEEDLYPETRPIASRNHITIQRTFTQTISERNR